jgi:hypothetical protein
MSISSVHAQEDLSISSQRALQEEKEEEQMMGTGSDLDAKEDEDSLPRRLLDLMKTYHLLSYPTVLETS